jgi:hypothetical protein
VRYLRYESKTVQMRRLRCPAKVRGAANLSYFFLLDVLFASGFSSGL